MATLEQITEEIEACIFPVNIDEKSNLVRKLVTYSKRSRAVIGMIVAKARRDNFSGDMESWKAWCQQNTGAVDAGRTHLNQIGSLLLDMHELLDEKIYQILLALDTNKLLAIYRLHSSQVEEFIKAYHPENNNVETVRHHVAFCLKEVDSPDLPEQSKNSNPENNSKWQPSLWDGIEVVFNFDEEDFYNLELDALKANKMMCSGIGMLSSSIKYWNDNGENTTTLAMVEAELRRQADTVKEIREQQAAELMNAS
ncbi:MAG: hypothetical protein L3J71_03660 [Victivallaceae bacterium]|nr:hypothetical protein [Victivallaceae bacterium]